MVDDNKDFCMSVDEVGLKMLLELEQNMNLACLVVERTAKQNCHVDQGHLRASINHDVKVSTQEIVGSVFSNLDYAPYEEKGTGVYAKDGNGRQTPWVYVKGAHSKKNNKPSKVYSWEKALQIMAILQRNGIDAHATKGQKPHPFLEPARDSNKEKVIKILGGKK